MFRVLVRLSSKKSSKRVHFTLAMVWASLLVPTLIWWKESLLWIAFMSLYANFVGHWSAYQAARAEKNDAQH